MIDDSLGGWGLQGAKAAHISAEARSSGAVIILRQRPSLHCSLLLTAAPVTQEATRSDRLCSWFSTFYSISFVSSHQLKAATKARAG